LRPTFFHHLHPPTIPETQARFRFTLGAGGLSVFLSLVIAVTGALEMYYYSPTPMEAPISIQTIAFLVPFGGLVRNLHFWASQFLVATAIIHFLRVIFTGAYSSPRRFNYLIGVILFSLILFQDFSGYILRWDEGIHWALITGTNLIRTIPGIGNSLYLVIVGGEQPGAATLTRFYAWHIFGLTLPAIIFLAWHIFRVRRDGGIIAPSSDLHQNIVRISRNELVKREVFAMLLASGILFFVSTFLPAPLSAPIGETPSSHSIASAPWFFLWVQQMLKFGNPRVFGLFIPLGILFIISIIPYIFHPIKLEETGRWFPPSGRSVQILVSIVILLVILLTVWASLDR